MSTLLKLVNQLGRILRGYLYLDQDTREWSKLQTFKIFSCKQDGSKVVVLD